ncbi:MAG: lipid II flippase MurJ, partial [Desulfobacterales bacterium]
NLAMIAAILIGVWQLSAPAMRTSALAVGVMVGGILQLGLQLPVLARHGVRFWRPARLVPGVLARFGRSTLPILLGGATYQVNVLLGTLLASYLAAGSVSYLFYADRLVQFPLGIFALSVVTVTMPVLSQQAAEQRLEALKETLLQSLNLVWFVTIPAMVGLIVLREPIVAVLFERGAFDSDSTNLTADALLWYGTGIWAYAALRIQLAVFYALQDAYPPLKAAAASVLVNLGAGLVLMRIMGHAGIALAAALAALVNLALLTAMLHRRIGPLGGWKLITAAARTLGCAVLMGAAVGWLNIWLIGVTGRGPVFLFGRLVCCIVVGVAVYLTAALLCRSPELRVCYQMMFIRRKAP